MAADEATKKAVRGYVHRVKGRDPNVIAGGDDATEILNRSAMTGRRSRDGVNAYGGTERSYPLSGGGWKVADDDKAFIKKRADHYQQEKEQKKEQERQEKLAAAAPPASDLDPEAARRETAKQQSMAINAQLRARKEEERRTKTEALTHQHRGEAEALNAKMEKLAPTPPPQAGKPFPSIADMLGDPSAAIKKMALLDEARKFAWVYVQGKQTSTKQVMDKCLPALIGMVDAVDKIVKQSDRDLKKIVEGHQGWGSTTDVYLKLLKELGYASANVAGARLDFTASPPRCEAGMTKLVAALKFNKIASEEVTDWANETIASADNAVYWGSMVRDGALDLLSVLAIAYSAPVWGAEMVIVATTGVVKAGLKGSDAYFAGKPIPLAEITFGFLLDLFTAGFGKWFEGSLKTALTKQAERLAADAAEKFMIERQVRREFVQESVASALDILRDLESEELKSFANDYLATVKKDKRPMWEIATFDKVLQAHFSVEHVTEVLRNTVWARVTNETKGRYKRE